MKYDGILFDLDGTLWDSSEGVALSWEAVLRNVPDVERPPTLEEIHGVMGMTGEDLMKKLFPYLSPERGRELFELCCRAENEYLRLHGGRLYPGMEDALAQLSERLPLAIVSNCNLGYIPAFLEAHRLHSRFRDWECIGRTGLEKWRNIGLVVERLGLKSPVYVGDTILDRQAADRAGLPFIHAAYGFGSVPEASAAVSSPAELPGLIFGEE